MAANAMVTLIIDDMGNNPDHGMDAIKLPGELTYAFLPNTPFASVLAELAHEKGRQVILHLPMEAEHHKRLGPNGLLQRMSEEEYKSNVLAALESVPHVTGMNNHMGSLLTQKELPMKWLMTVLRDKDLFFVDSRTTTKTIAQNVAENMGVTNIRRDVFIDNELDEFSMKRQLNELVYKAKKQGYATGIAHPYPETIAFLNNQLPLLKEQGIKLVPLSELINKKAEIAASNKRSEQWDPSLSLSPRVVKNSKP